MQPHKPFANLNAMGIENDPAVSFLLDRGQQVFLGMWEHGMPSGERTLTDAPRAIYPEGADELTRKDVDRANSLLYIKPRLVHDAFFGARAITLNSRRRANELYDSGHNRQAAAGAMTRDIEKAKADLGADADVLVAARDAVAAAQAAAENTFPTVEESEVQTTLYDSAIVARVFPLDTVEAALFKNGDAPERLLDPRTMQAICRVPRALHGLSDEQMRVLRSTYARRVAPATMEAVEYLGGMVEQARAAVAAAVLHLGQLALLTPHEAFASVRHGDWLEQVVNFLGLKKEELADMKATVEAAKREARPQVYAGKEWRPPVG